MKRLTAASLGILLGLAACSTGDGALRPLPPAATTTLSPAITTSTTTTTTLPRDCSPGAGPIPDSVGTAAAAGASLILSRATFPCADHVTIAPALDPAAADRAAAWASRNGGPLLLAGPDPADLAAEVDRLDPRTVSVAGAPRLGPSVLEGRRSVDVPGHAEVGSNTVGTAGNRVLVVFDAAVWPAVRVAATAAGEGGVLLGDGDPRRLAAEDPAVRLLQAASDLVWVGPAGDDLGWQVEVVRAGHQLPGGGQMLFPDRRLVAFYGRPESADLGVLGEQGVQGADATIDRMAPIVASYSEPGRPAVPAFEIIATIAWAEPTSDGDYSYETPLEVLRPWVETAGERGAYVILDLQPGRTDFLTQAMIYEEFVRLPHVGIALDPEWRLEPDQFHLRQIGSVDAAEIDAVAEWMAGIVREEALPQKLLLLHQFRLDMIPERPLVEVEAHPELAIAVQMDGWGPLPTKYETWGVLTKQPDSGRFWWGWKNFFDEDAPTMAGPAEVFALDPTVYFVSFQ